MCEHLETNSTCSQISQVQLQVTQAPSMICPDVDTQIQDIPELPDPGPHLMFPDDVTQPERKETAPLMVLVSVMHSARSRLFL